MRKTKNKCIIGQITMKLQTPNRENLKRKQKEKDHIYKIINLTNRQLQNLQ